MELRHLHYFIALAEQLNFSRAAMLCHVSQPPFSVAIQQLESYLGLQLVIRSSRTVELTDAGRDFYRRATQIVRSANQAFIDTQNYAQSQAHRLNIGFHGSMIFRGVTEMVKTFKQQFADVRVSLHEMSSKSQLEAVMTGDLDMGFTHSLASISSHHVGCINLFSERFVLCMPDSFRINASSVDLAKFKEENFIIFDRDASPYYFDTITSICLQAGFSPKIEHHAKQWLTTIALVSKGMGVAIVPECLAQTRIAGAIFRHIDTDIVAYLQCIYARTADQTLIRSMVDIAKSHIRSARLPDD
ncbi:LysR family transcriptional regulator [Advenella kashmirensis W13003]|uniref:LysR family transcriptional regulator n=1 Tax=Advenella kashmirensis W13003 TaxID=1424334 RepID=V8QYL4_9BURK|nr:LysR family transcriptional regulator [Advenella kashmirensis W13003]